MAGAIFNLTFVSRANAALGLLALTSGRPQEAVSHLELVRQAGQRSDNREPSLLEWMPDLIDAYVRVGRDDDAAELLDQFETYAQATDWAWALGASARFRGLLVERDDVDVWSSRHGPPRRYRATIEFARTELSWGSVEARWSTRRRQTPSPLGPGDVRTRRRRPWAERARTELRATGETARKRDPSAVERLTPQELQVALAIGEGRTNREAAAALFLSPKTIEYHLHNVYRKLDVRSRAELVRVITLDPTAAMHAV